MTYRNFIGDNAQRVQILLELGQHHTGHGHVFAILALELLVVRLPEGSAGFQQPVTGQELGQL